MIDIWKKVCLILPKPTKQTLEDAVPPNLTLKKTVEIQKVIKMKTFPTDVDYEAFAQLLVSSVKSFSDLGYIVIGDPKAKSLLLLQSRDNLMLAATLQIYEKGSKTSPKKQKKAKKKSLKNEKKDKLCGTE